MAIHNNDQPLSTGADSEIRPTPRELVAAIEAIERRKQHEEALRADREVISETVRELGVDTTPDEVLEEVERQRIHRKSSQVHVRPTNAVGIRHYTGGRLVKLGKRGKQRSQVAVLLYSLLTVYIYYFWWMYEVSQELQELDEEPGPSPLMDVVLSVLTFGLYIFYWDFKVAKKIVRIAESQGITTPDHSVLYTLLKVFAYGTFGTFVPAMMIQGQLNEIWAKMCQDELPPPA